MKLKLTPSLQHHLGIISLQLKVQATVEQDTDTDNLVNVESDAELGTVSSSEPHSGSDKVKATTATIHDCETVLPASMPKPELEKNEFRLLVKILQAIGHECVFQQIEHLENKVIYHHPNKDLIFHDITSIDDENNMNLSSLKDMNNDIKLKRAVWEKLKTLS